MRTIVIYKRKREKAKWLYITFPNKRMMNRFIARTTAKGFEIQVKTIRS